MEPKFDKRFLLTVIGLFTIAAAIGISRFYHLSDAVKGLLMGLGIGLMALPILLKKFRPLN